MNKGKLVVVSLIWLVLLTTGVLLYRLWFVPTAEKQAREAESKQEQEILDATSGGSQYKARIKLGLDGFSGYSVLRSDQFSQQLLSRGIKLDVVDDGANYEQRIKALANGELQFAAFPIDALLKSSQELGSLPATIVALVDESRGADALVAYKKKFPNFDTLNSPDTRFVLVEGSPSETLVRVLMRDLQWDQVGSQALSYVPSEKELVARYRAAVPGGNEVFVTWEPVVSELLVNDQLYVLADSQNPSGYIVDALVVSRDYLFKDEPTVRQVLESYFRALYALNEAGELQDLIVRDAQASGSKLTTDQAKKLVDGILWKNTQENYAHFGLAEGKAGVAHIERLIDRIMQVLLKTGGLAADPTDGNSEKLFNERPLAEMKASGFHPGLAIEEVRSEAALKPLDDAQWQQLVPVGTLSVPPLIFARGTSILTERSQRLLDELVGTLESWPQYYVLIRGNAGSRGDAEANRKLAKQRADAALQYLTSKGIAEHRLRALEGEITGDMSVSFILGQPAY